MGSALLDPIDMVLALKAAGMKQQQIADRTGLTSATITNFVNGRTATSRNVKFYVYQAIKALYDEVLPEGKVAPTIEPWLEPAHG